MTPTNWDEKTMTGLIYTSFNQAGTVSGRFSCVPLNTEILTEKGWRKYNQLRDITFVAGYDWDSNKLIWTKLKDVNVYKSAQLGKFEWRHYKGHKTNKNQYVYCTPNHKWLCNIQNVNGFIKSKDIKPKKNFLHNFILTAEGLHSQNSLLSTAEAGILGWAFTDGHVIKLKNGYACEIQVLKKSSIKYLKKLLHNIDYSYSKYFRGRQYHNRYKHRFYIPKHIFTEIWNKYLILQESLVFLLDKAAKVEMLNSMLEADGTPRKVTKSFFAQRKGIAEVFELLCFTLGFKVNRRQKMKLSNLANYENSTNEFTITKKPYEKHVTYTLQEIVKPVWCPTTKVGSWVMKQNNRIVITGNSSRPNMQNIPRKDEIGLRVVVIPDEGDILIGADYSQIELRVLAHFSQDRNLLYAYNNKKDIHQQTADALGLDRYDAKTINFGLVYGMGAKTLGKKINKPYDDAQKYIDAYFRTYPLVHSFW